MKKFNFFALTLLLALGLPLQAAVYKCEKEGVTTFSQTPCGDDAETTRYTTVGQSAAVVQNNAAISSKGATEVDAYIKQRQLKRQLKKLELEKDQKIAERNKTMNAIRDKQMTAKNNDVAGATYLQSLAQEMSAVVDAYDTEIKSLDQQLSSVKAELSKLVP